MQQFSHIISALTHNPKPMLRDYTQVPRMRLHPGLDGWITLNRTGEPQELIHDRYTTSRVWRVICVLGSNENKISDGCRERDFFISTVSTSPRLNSVSRRVAVGCIAWLDLFGGCFLDIFGLILLRPAPRSGLALWKEVKIKK